MSIEAVFDQVTDPSLRAVIQEEAHKQIKDLFKETTRCNPYAIPQAGRKVLEKYAIPYNPYSLKLHPHAASKAFEVSLYEAASNYLPSTSSTPVTFMFTKPGKLRFFRRRGHVDKFVNADIVPRDLARYPRDTVYSYLPEITTTHAFIGDTLHHFGEDFLVEVFSRSPKLEVLLATMVLPPEAFYSMESLHPSVYTLLYRDDRFLYLPGGLSGGEYEHRYKDLNWLTFGTVTHGGITITGERIETKAANHLFLFRRGRLATPKFRSFDMPEPMVLLPKVFRPAKYNVQKPIPREKANKWLMYVKSIGNATIRDVWAKLRQTIANADIGLFSPTELVHLTNYFLLLGRLDSHNSFDQVLADSVLKAWFRPMVAKLQEIKHKLMGQTQFMQLCQALEMTEVDLVFEVRDSKTPHKQAVPLDREIENVLLEGVSSEPTYTETEGVADGPLPPPMQTAAEPSATSDEPESSSSREIEHQPAPEITLDAEEPQRDDLPWDAWKTQLRALGFEASERQYDPDGELISPILSTRRLPKTPIDTTLYATLDKIARCPTFYKPDTDRAQTYARDVMAGKTGAILKQQPFEWKTTLKRKTKEEPKEIHLAVLHGAGGSGKSYALQEFMRNNPDTPITVILPTNELRADWKKKLPAHDKDTFMTYENALLCPRGDIFIMDDYTKLPRGYIEAFVQNAPALSLLILTGDPNQAEHFETTEDNEINDLAPASVVFGKFSRYHINATHRNPRNLANALGVYSETPGEVKVLYTRNIRTGYHNLVPSQMKMRNYASLGQRASTYAGCQGITAPRVQIILDSDTPRCTRQVMYTALSRATTEVVLCNTMPDEKSFFQKVEATPYLKAILNLNKEIKVTEGDLTEEPPREPAPPTTHLPVENRIILNEALVEPLPDKYDREIYSNSTGFSNCIQTQDPYIQAFQHQQAKDETLFWATVEKRLAASTPKDNWTEFRTKRPLGDVLWLAYKRAMELPDEPIKFNPELWWACADEVQKTYLSKPIHALKNGILRQSPDFDWNKLQIFLKSQWVKKIDKIGKIDVNAGQTIAAFYQPTVMLFGTMARYMRRIRDTYQPGDILINCEKNQKHISKWVESNWNHRLPAYTNDFTAYDQSQDGAMLQFEVLKALHHDIPHEVVEAYVALKLNSKMFLGTLAIMRLTGEGPTFDANTECNIAYTHARFEIPKNVAQMYAGDDCALNCRPVERQSFLPLVEKFTLKSKPKVFEQKVGSWPEFCGNLITPRGYLKDPMKLQHCLQLAQRKKPSEPGSLKDVAENYAMDLLPTYELGDALYEIFDERQMNAHYQSVRTLITCAHTKVLRVAQALQEDCTLFSSI
nr:RNA-dependent RNA polymerase [synthetic construct]